MVAVLVVVKQSVLNVTSTSIIAPSLKADLYPNASQKAADGYTIETSPDVMTPNLRPGIEGKQNPKRQVLVNPKCCVVFVMLMLMFLIIKILII